MLATLMQHCCPDTVSNAFTSLLLLFNDVQGESTSILEYWSQFDGLTLKLARCKVMIPSVLLVMLFLCALHGWYSLIVDQFRSCFKPIKTTTLILLSLMSPSMMDFRLLTISKWGSQVLPLDLVFLLSRWPTSTLIARARYGSLLLSGWHNME